MNTQCRRNGPAPKRLGLYPKETNRWLRAIELAGILFEDQGYHRDYLNEIDEFIRREKIMYTPKIQPELIPVLYHRAKAERLPMTKLVDRIIRGYLEATKQNDAEHTNSRD